MFIYGVEKSIAIKVLARFNKDINEKCDDERMVNIVYWFYDACQQCFSSTAVSIFLRALRSQRIVKTNPQSLIRNEVDDQSHEQSLSTQKAASLQWKWKKT